MPSKRPILPEDSLAFKSLGGVQFSPDGAAIAFTVADATTPHVGHRRSRVWLAATDGGAVMPFSAGIWQDHSPVWSPDGEYLAFLSNREDAARHQIYVASRRGGEAQLLGALPASAEDIAWSPDGAQIAFLMTDPETPQQAERSAAGFDEVSIEGHHRWQRLWTVDVASGALHRITGELQVWEYSWRRDGGFALVIGSEPYEWSWFTAALAEIGPGEQRPTTIASVPERQFACPRTAPSGSHVAALSAIWSDRGVNGGDLLLVPVDGGETRNLTEGYSGSVWWSEWSDDGATIETLAYEDGRATIGRMNAASGARTVRWSGEVHFGEDTASGYYCRATGCWAFIRDDSTAPPELWMLDAADTWHQLTHIHGEVETMALGETRTVRWSAPDGTPIQGLLILPVGYREGQRVPLVTWVHGGPAWLSAHGFYGTGRYVQQSLAGRGMAVLLPNPRGSVGWGRAFGEANIGDLGGADYGDIMAGVDHIVALGIADERRLGIGGWSYGGYMSAWATTQTARFAAAIVGAAIINWRSFHGTASIGTWDAISYRASPFQIGNVYDSFAPIAHVANVSTPTLILHGSDDTIVPVTQGYEWFRALKDRGVPVELVVYPREPHGFMEHPHVLDRSRRYIDWFVQYLTPEMENQ